MDLSAGLPRLFFWFYIRPGALPRVLFYMEFIDHFSLKHRESVKLKGYTRNFYGFERGTSIGKNNRVGSRIY